MRPFLFALGILMILAGAAWFAAPSVKKDFRPYLVYSDGDLEALVNNYTQINRSLNAEIETESATFDAEVRRLVEQGKLPPGGENISEPLTVREKRKQLAGAVLLTEKMWAENAIRNYKFKELAAVLIGLGSLIVLLTALLPRFRKAQFRKLAAESLPDEEKYVTEYQFAEARVSAFDSEKKALDWLKNDPMKNCDYCGGPLDVKGLGFIKTVRYLKKVPEGAADLKITLGELFYAHSHDSATCKKCGKVNTRGGPKFAGR